MNKLPSLRLEIEKLHQDLLQLVLRRQKLVQQIWIEKQAHKIDLTDTEREHFLIHQFDQYPELQQDEAMKQAYHNVVKSIIAENKKYLKK